MHRLPAQPVALDAAANCYVYTHPTGERVPLRRVSEAISAYYTPFNPTAKLATYTPEVAAVKAAEWAASSPTGTAVHAWIESFIKSGPYGSAGRAMSTDEVPTHARQAFAGWWGKKTARRWPEIGALEYPVGCPDLGIGGTVDALLYHDPIGGVSKGGLHIYDWKTSNYGDFTKQWPDASGVLPNLLPPFDQHPDCKLTRYSLQLSLYRLLLRRAGIETLSATIVHVPLRPGDTCTAYKALDFTDELERLLLPSAAATQEQREMIVRLLNNSAIERREKREQLPTLDGLSATEADTRIAALRQTIAEREAKKSFTLQPLRRSAFDV